MMSGEKRQSPAKKTKVREGEKSSSRVDRTTKPKRLSSKPEKRTLVLRRRGSKEPSMIFENIPSVLDPIETAISMVNEPMVVLDFNLQVVTANRPFYDFSKVIPEKIKGELFFMLGNRQWDIPEFRQKLEQVLHDHTSFENLKVRLKLPRSQESIRLIKARVVDHQNRKPQFILLTITDVTDYRKTGESVEKFYSFPDVNPMPIVETDQAGKVLYMNPAAKKLFPDLSTTGVKHPFLAGIPSAINELKEAKSEWVRRQVKAEGAWYGQTIYTVENGSRIRIYSVDITEAIRIRQVLQANERKFKSIFDESPIGIEIYDLDGKLVEANKACLEIFGISEVAEVKGFYLFQDPNLSEETKEKLLRGQMVRYEGPFDFEKVKEHKLYQTAKSGMVYLDVVITPLTAAGEKSQRGYLVQVQDISERKHKEDKLQQLNRVLKALSDSNQAMMRSTSDSGYMDEVCRLIIEDCGYAMVWIGFTENDENKTVRPVAQAGFEEGYLETVNITWADTERGRGPTGTAIRTGKPAICRNMLTDPDFEPWRKEAFKRGYASSIVIPLIANGKTFGAINIYSKEPDPFSEEEINLLTELSNDLAYGITTLRLRWEHQQAEAALAKSEEKYRFLYEEGQSFNIILGPDQTLKDTNKTALNILGYQKEEVIGKPVLEFIPDEEKERAKEILAETFSGGPTAETEIPVLAKDGSVHTILFSPGQAILMESGAIAGIVVTGIDITERKQAEEKLQEQAVMLANISEAIIGFGPDMTINFWSPSAERLYGYTSAEALGRQASDLLRAVYLGITRDEAVAQLMKTGHLEVENIHHTKSGRALHVEYHATGIHNLQNEITGIATVMHDITERKKAEEELRQTRDYLENLFNYANAPIICWDSEFKITRFNHAFEHLTDYKAEEVLGKDLSILFPQASREESLDKIRRTLGGEYWEVVEIPILRKTGDTRIVLWNSANVYADDGKTLLATIAQGHDITERKRNEEEIRALNEHLKQHEAELAASNQELEAFSYSVSHDLRAPLRNIDGFSQALLEDYHSQLDEKGKDYLNRVRSATQHMGGLIDDLLSLSVTMRKEMKREKVDLSRLALHITEELKETQPEHLAEIIIQDNMFVRGDAPLLREMLVNLLGNAWKFTSKRTPARIEFGSTEKNGETVFFIKDNGAGFDIRYVDKLFLPFQRLHSTTEFAGNGIGLAIVKRIIDRHGGAIWAEGETEKGATFYFKLG